ncbi:MAG: conjugal transfer protein TrbE [Azoarcus sp.]|nr:conjugal transfer protein TrbE [Azoarcus sp.]
MFISLLLAASGAALLVALFGRLRVAGQAAQIRQHRKKWMGLADLLAYAAEVAPGVVVCKSGALLAAYMYKGTDTASCSEHEREQIVMNINRALQPLGSGWMVHVDAVRREAPGYMPREASHFPDVVSQAIDEERRQFFNERGATYDGYFVITVTWFPPLLVQKKFVELMFDDDRPAQNSKAATRALLEKFEQELNGIESRLSLAVDLHRLRDHAEMQEDGSQIVRDDLLGWLQYCITGSYVPVQLPANPMYLDCVLGGQEMWGGIVPKIGGKYVQIVAVEGFPLQSTPGMLAALAEQACTYRWSSRFIFMDTHEAVEHLDKFRKKWKQKIRSFISQVFNTQSGSVDQDAVDMTADAEQAMGEVSSGMVGLGYYTSVVVLMDEDRAKAEQAAVQLQKVISRLGFVARIETINTMDAFFGSLPGHAIENIRRPLIHTLNLADLLPTSTIWTGEQAAPCPFYGPDSPPLMQVVTHGATPFWLNLHVRDLGHTLVFGPPGAGKSTLLATFIAQLLRYKNMTIYAFDKGHSAYAITKACGGRHFSIAGDDETLAFSPMQFLETPSDRSWAMEWIDNILAMNDLTTTPEQRVLIAEAILSMKETGAKTISEFHTAVQDTEIRAALKPYTVEGMMGHLLDAPEDGLALTKLMCFEVEDLMNLGDKYAIPVLLYLFRRIERSLTGQPTAIILDEAWLMLQHPVFREKIREWLKVLRKANCIVILATQSLSDAARSGIVDVLIETTATKIFLPNLEALNEDTSEFYRRFGLNTKQIDIIARAQPKRDYYVISERGRRLFNLALGPLALAFVGVSDKDTLTLIKQLEAKHGEQWVNEWLAFNRVRLSDYADVPLYLEAA